MSDTENATSDLPDYAEGTIVEKISKSEIVPLFDGHHEHIYIRDDEETDEYYAEVCTVKGCMMGRLVSKV